MFTFHIIKTESINFAQIQKEDSYFERAHLSVLFLCVQINHTGKELLFLIFKEITLRNHSSLHKLFYSLVDNEYSLLVIYNDSEGNIFSKPIFIEMPRKREKDEYEIMQKKEKI